MTRRRCKRRTPPRLLLLASLLSASACGGDPAENVLITRVRATGSGAIALDCIEQEALRDGARSESVLVHPEGLRVERAVAERAVAVSISTPTEVLARRDYDSAFIEDARSDRFTVEAGDARFELTFWAAGTCAAPAPGEIGRVAGDL